MEDELYDWTNQAHWGVGLSINILFLSWNVGSRLPSRFIRGSRVRFVFFTGGVQQSYWQGSPAQSVGEFVDVYHK